MAAKLNDYVSKKYLNPIPFPFPPHGGPAFISTLIKYDSDQQRAPFLYHRLIKQIDLYQLAEAIQEYYSSFSNASINTATLYTLKKLCHKLINSTENTFFELNCQYDSVKNSTFGDWNIYQIPNANASLSKLQLCQLISYIKLFNNLKSLNIYVSDETNGDKLLSELGKNLPKILETLYINGDFEFSEESLEKFLLGAREVKFQSLGFPESVCISDGHLETILRAIHDSSLDISIKKLVIYCARFVTTDQAIKFQDQRIEYETLRSTLTAHPDTLLGTMFAERNKHLLRPKNGNEYFIDRNSRAFYYIMEYYRTGVMNWPNRNSEENKNDVSLQELNTELDYFQIKVKLEDRRAENIVLQLSKSLDSFVFYLEENFGQHMENMESDIWFRVSPDAEPKFWIKNSGWISSPFTSNKSLAFHLMKRFRDEIYQHLKTTFNRAKIETRSQNNDHIEFIFTPYYDLDAILNLTNLKYK
ncbi:5486_t:CDS:2 [Ambispora gerdemannii]|uniref:5486_t:CDS:1 n=1 Tax=Ambispora gerdemannii TaxID=144530 RepID=A0A9N9B699_9GLOM|nr:5486_t:CDS:2 [Ambispora gerdemannii]